MNKNNSFKYHIFVRQFFKVVHKHYGHPLYIIHFYALLFTILFPFLLLLITIQLSPLTHNHTFSKQVPY